MFFKLPGSHFSLRFHLWSSVSRVRGDKDEKTQQTKNEKLSSPYLSHFTENLTEEEEEKEEVEIKEEEMRKYNNGEYSIAESLKSRYKERSSNMTVVMLSSKMSLKGKPSEIFIHKEAKEHKNL